MDCFNLFSRSAERTESDRINVRTRRRRRRYDKRNIIKNFD